MQQRSESWFAHRRGKVTGSRVKDVLGTAAARRRYMLEIIAERLDMPLNDFQNNAMRRGIALEPEARLAYEIVTGSTVVEIGFADHPDVGMFGASPDGLIEDDIGCIEIKCPESIGYLDVRLSSKPPKEHIAQMQAVMACTGTAWCDYVIYHPDDPGGVAPIRVQRDEDYIAAMLDKIVVFNREVDDWVKRLRGERA